jgi:membrane protease YdiL (CAAX protease family)
MSFPEPEIPATPRPRSHWRIIWTSVLSFLAATALCIVLVVVIMIVTLVFTGFSGSKSFRSLLQSPLFLVSLLVAVELPLAGVGLFLRYLDRKSEFRPQALFDTIKLSAIVTGIGAGLALLVFGALNAYIATKVFGTASTESMEAVARAVAELKGHPGKAAAAVFTIGVLAPVCEELFFRGALFARGRAAGKAWTAAVVSSALFAVAHMNGAMSLYYFAVGIAMCFLFRKTGTLASPIAAHMTVNLTACIAMLIGVDS